MSDGPREDASRKAVERDPAGAVEVVELAALPGAASGGGPVVVWSASNQLQTNVVVLPPLAGIGTHVEPALDVTLTVLTGSLTLEHQRDGGPAEVAVVHAPAVVVLPAGTRRSLTAGEQGASYLTAHRRRTGMLPTVRRR